MTSAAAWRALRFLIALSPVLLLAAHDIDSADVWTQLATGDLVLRARALPAVDPFGQATPPRPWIVHDWLSGVLLRLLHGLGGPGALVVCSALLAAVALMTPLVLALRAGRASWPYELALLGSTCIAYERFFVRPEMFALPMASLWVAALASGAPRSARSLALLAVLQIAWSNTHASFPMGPAIAALALGCDLLRHHVDRRHGRRAPIPRPRLALLPTALLAACATPYGPRLLVHLSRAGGELSAGELQRGIAEWQPTFAAPVAGDFVLMVFVATLVALGLALLLGRRHVRLFELVLALGILLLACTARRHLALYAVLVPPMAAAWSARHLQAARWRPPFARLLGFLPPVLSLLLGLDVARGAFYARCGPPRTLGFGFSTVDHPIAAGDFVARHGLPGPMFNNVAAGSYLLWRLRGDPPVLVDGRLLDPEAFRTYRAALGSPAAFDAFAARHGTQLVVLALQPSAPAALVRHLAADSSWAPVYLDGEGAVFVRTGIARAKGLARLDLARALAHLPAPAERRRGCDPGPEARRGEMLLRLGFPEPARADFEAALDRCPERLDLAAGLGAALVAVGHPGEARSHLERALASRPEDAEAWLQLGLAHAALGDVRTARIAWERSAALAPWDPRPRRLLGLPPP